MHPDDPARRRPIPTGRRPLPIAAAFLAALAAAAAHAGPIVPEPAVPLPADDVVHLRRCLPAGATTTPLGRPCNPVDTDPNAPFLEWHYWTAHLHAADGRRFGAQW